MQLDSTASAPPISESQPPEEEEEEAQSQETTTVERIHPDVPSSSEIPLPAGWAMQLAPNNNRVFFINHNTRTTSWVSKTNDTTNSRFITNPRKYLIKTWGRNVVF